MSYSSLLYTSISLGGEWWHQRLQTHKTHMLVFCYDKHFNVNCLTDKYQKGIAEVLRSHFFFLKIQIRRHACRDEVKKSIWLRLIFPERPLTWWTNHPPWKLSAADRRPLPHKMLWNSHWTWFAECIPNIWQFITVILHHISGPPLWETHRAARTAPILSVSWVPETIIFKLTRLRLWMTHFSYSQNNQLMLYYDWVPAC